MSPQPQPAAGGSRNQEPRKSSPSRVTRPPPAAHGDGGGNERHPMSSLYPSAAPDDAHHSSLHVYKGHRQPVRTLVVGEGGLMYTASEDGTAQQWRISDGAPLVSFKGHTDWVTSCVVMGPNFFTASADGSVREWSCSDGRPRRLYEGSRWLCFVCSCRAIFSCAVLLQVIRMLCGLSVLVLIIKGYTQEAPIPQ